MLFSPLYEVFSPPFSQWIQKRGFLAVYPRADDSLTGRKRWTTIAKTAASSRRAWLTVRTSSRRTTRRVRWSWTTRTMVSSRIFPLRMMVRSNCYFESEWSFLLVVVAASFSHWSLVENFCNQFCFLDGYCYFCSPVEHLIAVLNFFVLVHKHHVDSPLFLSLSQRYPLWIKKKL